MIVMPSNNTHWAVHYLAGRYGHIGHLYSPGSRRGPFPHIPYALDNGAYSAYSRQATWDDAAFIAHIEMYAWAQFHPCWVVVPDVVGDRDATLRLWDEWELRLARSWSHIDIALAVQDGMDEHDVRNCNPDLLFVGGTTDWKWSTMPMWTGLGHRVHVARVNGIAPARLCAKHGVESIDGTGWFRSAPQAAQFVELVAELADQPFDASFAAALKLSRKDQMVLL